MLSTINIQDKIILNPTSELCFMKSFVYHVDLYEYATRHVRLYEKVSLCHYGVTMTSLRNERYQHMMYGHICQLWSSKEIGFM